MLVTHSSRRWTVGHQPNQYQSSPANTAGQFVSMTTGRMKEDVGAKPCGNPIDKRHPWNQTTIRVRRNTTQRTCTSGNVATLAVTKVLRTSVSINNKQSKMAASMW